MPRKRATLDHVKVVRSKGHTYHYFDTGRKSPGGRKIYARLPTPGSPDYGSVYASYLAGRNRKGEVTTILTVPMLVEMFFKSPHYRKTIKDGSRKIYRIYLNRFAKLMPTAPAEEVTRADVAILMDNMADTPGAANTLVGSIAALYKWARERHHVSNEPTKEIAPLPTGEHAAWPEHVLEAALASEDADVRLATHLLYYTAQRISDVLKMRWSDIEDGRIKVEQKKTGRKLLIPMHDALVAELATVPRKSLFILAGPGGKQRSDDTVREWLQSFAASLGVKVVPHGLRKNAVNALLEAGCSAAEVASITGQSLQMIEHYAKQRSQPRIATGTVLKWNKAEPGKRKENQS